MPLATGNARLSTADELPVNCQELLKWCRALMAFGVKDLVDLRVKTWRTCAQSCPRLSKAWQAAVKAPEPVLA